MAGSANFEIYQLGEQVMKIDNGFSTTHQLCFSHGNHYDIVYPEVCPPLRSPSLLLLVVVVPFHACSAMFSHRVVSSCPTDSCVCVCVPWSACVGWQSVHSICPPPIHSAP